ncbi:HAD family hydrolase [Pedobacter caeni]|uniref:Putative hydrolase of the HAD superfamily n=1 Tax=Pedobacter caeni TaxID=288992 RepID=A0A1M5K209_9SPHI|nr:HAD family phosphatase [Pedobacter caeni]SHG46580.1 putative hydrolase of the HAD superfamily [Pedobacter caeni]
MKPITIKALLLDIGGVLLTNGWDSASRRLAAEHFSIDFAEMNDRHRIIFDAYESGKMTLDEYLNLLVFCKERDFSMQEFKDFMFGQSQAYPETIALIKQLKQQYGLQVIAVNNEGRELNEYRVSKFDLKSFFDIFSSSCFVHTRKPDKDFYTIALDLAQVKADEVIYLDDRLVFIQAAQQLGITGIHHSTTENTRLAFAEYGLKV